MRFKALEDTKEKKEEEKNMQEDSLLEENKSVNSRSLEEAKGKSKETDSKTSTEKSEEVTSTDDPNLKLISNVSIVKLLDTIVEKAWDFGASDVHIEPKEKLLSVRYRIDGLLRQYYLIDKALEPGLIFKIKVSSKLRTDEHQSPQDGRINFEFKGKKLDTRISIIPTAFGEKIVIRLLSQGAKNLGLEDLGFIGRDYEVVKKSYSMPYGMILAVGPTGSGKTTTLYSILKILNSPQINITTIEDPIEYNIEGVNHIQVNVKANLTFANGLRTVLRQDPDVIMIGEIRDSETAKIAINSAMTGHLVLSTLHTNDAVTTIPRLLNMEVERFLIASTLNVIIAQRLARRLCSNCKKKETLTDSEHAEINKFRPDIAKLIKPGEEIYKEAGCDECSNTGFKGRLGLYEVLEASKKIRELITTGASTDEIFNAARSEGLTTIIEDGVKKVLEGKTSIQEIIRVTALKE